MSGFVDFLAADMSLAGTWATIGTGIAIAIFAGLTYRLSGRLAQHQAAPPVLLYPVRGPEPGLCRASLVSYRGLVWRIALVNSGSVPSLLEKARLECQISVGARSGRWTEKEGGWAIVLEDGREYEPVRPHVVGSGAVLVLQIVLHDPAVSASLSSSPAPTQPPRVRLRLGFCQRRQSVSGVTREWLSLESAPVGIPSSLGMIEEHTVVTGVDETAPDVRAL